MNRQAKSAMKSLVLALRHELEGDIEIQLKRYGFAGERWLDLDRLPLIQRDDQAAIDHFRLKAALEQHLRRIGADAAKATSGQRAYAPGEDLEAEQPLILSPYNCKSPEKHLAFPPGIIAPAGDLVCVGTVEVPVCQPG